MKNIFVALFLALCIVSCSDNDDSTGNNSSKSVLLSLHAKQAEGNILDMVDFYIAPNKDCTMQDIKETYDSILWRVQGLEGTFKLLEHTNNSSNFVFSWGHTFYSNGNYNTIIEGFKDGKIIQSDTVEIKILDKCDFLNINWADITSTDLGLKGNNNVLNPDFEIYFTQTFENDKPSAFVYFIPNRYIYTSQDKEDNYYIQKQEAFILEYISALYGTPKFSIDKNKATIAKEYNDTFLQEDSSYTPRYIWKTSTSNIALVEKYDEWEEHNKYYIYAEPIH